MANDGINDGSPSFLYSRIPEIADISRHHLIDMQKFVTEASFVAADIGKVGRSGTAR